MRLLDFSEKISTSNSIAYKVRGNKNEVCVIPKFLTTSTSKNGLPAFKLEAIRGITPFSNPKPYGLFEIQFSGKHPDKETILSIKKHWPEATINIPDFSQGFLGLSLVGIDGKEISTELETPIRLHNLPLSRFRFVKKVSNDYVTRLLKALKTKVLLLKGYGKFSVKGYAPSIGITVTFDPAILTDALIQQSNHESGYIALENIKDFFSKKKEELPLISFEQKDSIDKNLFTECFTDWYCKAFCHALPPKPHENEIYFELRKDALVIGEFIWDFSKPNIVERFYLFRTNALEEASKIVKQGKLSQIYTETIIESLPKGFFRLEVFHPFFENPIGIEQIGIKLSALSNPPHRKQAIHETVIFNKGLQKEIVSLRYSVKETPKYLYTPFVIYKGENGTKEVLGKTYESSLSELVLERKDFPFHFASISCSNNILKNAILTLNIKKEDAIDDYFQPIAINDILSSISLALPKDEGQFVCRATAASKTSDEVVCTEVPLHSDYTIDLTSFKEYGAHKVTLTYDAKDDKIVAVDLLPSHLEDTVAHRTTVILSQKKSSVEWTWFSDTIFKSGFRYRINTTPKNDWSKVYSASTKTLKINIK